MIGPGGAPRWRSLRRRRDVPGLDALALAPLTQRITYLEDGDWAIVTTKGTKIFDADNKRSTARSSAPRSRRPDGQG